MFIQLYNKVLSKRKTRKNYRWVSGGVKCVKLSYLRPWVIDVTKFETKPAGCLGATVRKRKSYLRAKFWMKEAAWGSPKGNHHFEAIFRFLKTICKLLCLIFVALSACFHLIFQSNFHVILHNIWLVTSPQKNNFYFYW